MNTSSHFSFALVSILACGTLAGCTSQADMTDDMSEEAIELVAQSEEALTSAATAPVLNAGQLYRVEIMRPTSSTDPSAKCLDFPGSLVSLGQPLVRRTCNNQQLDNNTNTQSFYFEPVYSGSTRVANTYYMKPAHKMNQTEDLCVYNSGQTNGNGGNLLAGTCNPNTLARIVEIKAYTDSTQTAPWNSFLTINMAHSKKCLTVVGSYPGENVTITQYGTADDADLFCSNWPNQRVRIITE